LIAPKADQAASPVVQLLRLERLHVSFATPQGVVEAVKDVSLTIAAGEILALVGESGSGKSVTARALVGLPGPHATVTAATMLARGHGGTIDLMQLSPKAWRRIRGREIGFILQDALVSLDPLRTVGREVAEPIMAHQLSPRSGVAAAVEALLARAGIPDPKVRAAQYPHELSGGLRQRALIASALAGEPLLLIADEPTTALDTTVQRQVLSVFSELARAGHGVLLITHDLAVVASIADRVAVMQGGEIVEEGPTQSVLTAPAHAYTRRLLGAVPSTGTRGKWLSPTAAAAPQLLSRPSAATPILEMHGISVGYRRADGSRFAAVTDASLHLDAGETLGIVGESGSGKTTLGLVALALRRPDRGEVKLHGQPWSTLAEPARRPLRGRIQAIMQDPLSSFDPQYTVQRIIEQPLRVRAGLRRTQRVERVVELMEMVGLSPDLLARRPRALSGGQRQRVSIAQALASSPELLVCDEPVSALDVTTQAQVLDLLVALQDRLGLAMLFISHDLRVIQHMSHRIVVMQAGRIVETGSAGEIFDNPEAVYTRRLLDAVPPLPTVVRGPAAEIYGTS
jgi:peptide/nickel transport system ATP-binding protein